MRTVLLSGLLAIIVGAGSIACTETDDDAGASTTATEATNASATSDSTTGTSSTESSTDTETETGQMCTGELCASTLTLTLPHALPLLDGPHLLVVETPYHEVLCSISATSSGSESCFGFMFSDLDWTEDLVTLVLTNPFFDTLDNPEAAPFESVSVRVERDQNEIFAATVPLDSGDPIQPDPCGAICWEAEGSVTIE